MNRIAPVLFAIFAVCASYAQAGVIVSSEMVGGIEQVDVTISMVAEQAPEEGQLKQHRPEATGSLSVTTINPGNPNPPALSHAGVSLEPVKSVNVRFLRDRTFRLLPAPMSLLRPA